MQQRRRGTQLILAGIIVVVLVLGIGLFLANRGGSSPSKTAAPATTPEVVAIQTIPQGTVFRQGQDLNTFFVVRQAPPSLVPIGAYSSIAQIQSLIVSTGCAPGQVNCASQVTTTQTIYQNSPVASGMFSNLGQFRNAAGPSFTIPYGYVGIALSFDPINSVIGSIFPGDDIDVIASYHGAAVKGINAQPQTQFVMNDMRVLSVNQPPSAQTGSAPVGGGTLLVLARFQQALVVQHLKDFGWQLSAVLRSAKESDIPHFKTLPVTDRWFWKKSQNPLKEDPGY
ncbi:MAG TPA: RcpC/CpaB family pilus assembly protein [Chloroflexota bacterium]